MYFYTIAAGIFLVIAITLEITFREHLFRHLKARLTWVLAFVVLAAPWDALAIKAHHWIFPGQGILKIYVGVIPIEEFLWYIIVPYFSLTVYKTIHVVFDKKNNAKRTH